MEAIGKIWCLEINLSRMCNTYGNQMHATSLHCMLAKLMGKLTRLINLIAKVFISGRLSSVLIISEFKPANALSTKSGLSALISRSSTWSDSSSENFFTLVKGFLKHQLDHINFELIHES